MLPDELTPRLWLRAKVLHLLRAERPWARRLRLLGIGRRR